MWTLRIGILATSLVLGAAAVLRSMPESPSRNPGYEVLRSDLEPFRSEFNAASDRARAVLLVGPT